MQFLPLFLECSAEIILITYFAFKLKCQLSDCNVIIICLGSWCLFTARPLKDESKIVLSKIQSTLVLIHAKAIVSSHAQADIHIFFFIPWGTRCESLNYRISNYWPPQSERERRDSQNPQVRCQPGQPWPRYRHSKTWKNHKQMYGNADKSGQESGFVCISIHFPVQIN